MAPFITDKNHISTSALYDPNYLSHGIQWGKHRYVRREGSVGNWRYIYPEDLKKAGQNLVSGTRNLVSKAGNAVKQVSKAAGFPQRKEYIRAQNNLRIATGNTLRAQDPLKTPELGNKNDPRRSKAIARAAEIERNVGPKMGEAYKQYSGTFAEAFDDISGDVSYEVERFLNSKVGIGQRKNIDIARSRFVSLDKKIKNTVMGSQEYLALVDEYNAAYKAYTDSLQRYGKTFLGSIENFLNTDYSKMLFTQPKGWGPKN